ncbi:hypothetical protein GCM10023075_60100 [Streptosporangium album]|uniref:phosphotransferase n=1 Tax=Streptosporangium album TaxID=47479 RepID=UPI001608CECF
MRGVPLATLTHEFDKKVHAIASSGVPAGIREIWDDAVSAPDGEGPPVWLHGDLHPANVVVSDGALSGVIDFGQLGAGDPAADPVEVRCRLPTDSPIFEPGGPISRCDRGVWHGAAARGSCGMAPRRSPSSAPTIRPNRPRNRADRGNRAERANNLIKVLTVDRITP